MTRRNRGRGGQQPESRNNRRDEPRDQYRQGGMRNDNYGNGSRDYRDAPYQQNRPPGGGYGDGYRFRGQDSNSRTEYRSSEHARDNYRPHGDGYRRPPPPPRSPPPPPPSEPRPPQGDFTFRFDKPAGVESTGDSYRPNGNFRSGQDRPIRRMRNDRNRGRGRPSWRPFVAAERALLSARPSNNKEEAMFNSENEARYKPIDELSDSDEADMDISGDEEQEGERTSKRARLTDAGSSAAASVPKWSNPDPYTALPPPDTLMNQKKKDVVQLIRKARVEATEAKVSLPAEAADFISCDFDSDDGSEKEPSPLPESVPRGPKSDAVATVQPETIVKTVEDNRPAGLPPRPPTRFDETKNSSSRKGLTENKAPTTQKSQNGGKQTEPSALGNRKRTHDDKIKLPEHARLKKVVRMPSGGGLIPEWKVTKGEDPCPWNTNDHSDTPVMGVWLHKEIVDFFEHVRPRDFEDEIRSRVREDLQTFCRNMYGKDVSILAFGSWPSGLYLPTGDMDLVLVSDQYLDGGYGVFDNRKFFWRLSSVLRQNNMAHLGEVEVIARAKVPLVKYIETRTGLKMDISFENLTGVQAVKTFNAWKEQYPAMPVLVTLIKHFLAMRGLNEPVNGGIGGFSVICLVVSMLQMMPQVQSENMNPSHHQGDLLMEFLDLYGNRFNYNEVAISLNPPKYIPKNKITAFGYQNMDRLSIVDPNNPENDIAGGASNTARIMKAFSEAHHQLVVHMEKVAQMPDRRGASLLEPILAGNYSSFRLQREHLKKLYDNGLDFQSKQRGPRQPKW